MCLRVCSFLPLSWRELGSQTCHFWERPAVEECNLLLLADGAGNRQTSKFVFLFSFLQPLAPLHWKDSVCSAPSLDSQGFTYSNDCFSESMQLWAETTRSSWSTLWWGGLAAKVSGASGQRAEYTAPSPVKTPSLENIMWVWVILWRTCFSEFGLAVQADVILPFIFFPALLKSNHFQSPYMRGTLRDGLEPHGGSLFGSAFWDLARFEAVANGDCTLWMKCHTDVWVNPWEQRLSTADVRELENSEMCVSLKTGKISFRCSWWVRLPWNWPQLICAWK